MKKKVTKPATKLKAKRAKLLTALKHCCIPTTVVKTVVEVDDNTKMQYTVNPDIKPNGNGKKWKPDQDYRDTRDARKKYLREHYKNAKHPSYNKPWYYLTIGKCKNYEEHQENWGSHINYFRVKSETKKFHDKYTPKKFNKEVYVIKLLQSTVKDWEKTHPMPTETIEGTKNAFYQQEYSTWLNDRSEVWNKRHSKIKNIPDHVKEKYLQYIGYTEPKIAA